MVGNIYDLLIVLAIFGGFILLNLIGYLIYYFYKKTRVPNYSNNQVNYFEIIEN
jgi:hypothetical protein